jgi:hypothetical protein
MPLLSGWIRFVQGVAGSVLSLFLTVPDTNTGSQTAGPQILLGLLGTDYLFDADSGKLATCGYN